MLSLNTHLNTIGISTDKVVDLVMQRDQVNAALPRNNGAAGQASGAAAAGTKPTTAANQLTPAQQQQIEELRQIDGRVHRHEQAHIAAAGGLITSGPDYTYTYGPDGKPYAIGGEVGIDTSAEKKPEDNIDKGLHIQAAALAPADPSAQDYQVASLGGRLEAQGHGDLVRQQQEERVAQEEAARQKREVQAGGAGAAPVRAPSQQAPTQDHQVSVRSAGGTGTLVQTAYATVAAGPANAGRVSVFA